MRGFLERVAAGFSPDAGRRDAIRAVEKRLRLKFRARNARLPKRYHFIDELRTGSGDPQWRGFNSLTGMYHGLYVKFFDCSMRGRHDDPSTWFSCFLYQHKQFFPEVRIHRRRASGIDQYLNTVSRRVVEVETAPPKFRRDFIVKSDDAEFAGLVCSEPLMYYLLGSGEGACEIERNVVCLRLPRRVDPEEIETNLDRLVRLREYLPKDYIPNVIL